MLIVVFVTRLVTYPKDTPLYRSGQQLINANEDLAITTMIVQIRLI